MLYSISKIFILARYIIASIYFIIYEKYMYNIFAQSQSVRWLVLCQSFMYFNKEWNQYKNEECVFCILKLHVPVPSKDEDTSYKHSSYTSPSSRRESARRSLSTESSSSYSSYRSDRPSRRGMACQKKNCLSITNVLLCTRMQGFGK